MVQGFNTRIIRGKLSPGSANGLELLPFFGVLSLSRFGKRLQILILLPEQFARGLVKVSKPPGGKAKVRPKFY